VGMHETHPGHTHFKGLIRVSAPVHIAGLLWLQRQRLLQPGYKKLKKKIHRPKITSPMQLPPKTLRTTNWKKTSQIPTSSSGRGFLRTRVKTSRSHHKRGSDPPPHDDPSPVETAKAEPTLVQQ
jgi:hypothetical protein